MPKKILVVEDDPDIFEALTMIFERQGYQVISARDGIEGLACLKAERPDLMILDLLMPKMDGFAVLNELRGPRWAEFTDTPILVLTSVREEASRRRYKLETGLELRADSYVEKPISPDIILKRVEKLIKRKQEV